MPLTYEPNVFLVLLSRSVATFAFFMPIRFASFMPQTLREDHFFVR